MEDQITISKEKLRKLLTNFYESCSLCDEMNIYEFPEDDEHMQEMKKWANKEFGRKITKESYKNES